LARFPLQAAFRFHRRAGDTSKLDLEWNRFPEGSVLSAIADRATITTLLNVEGKSLTEVALRIRNHAQAFVKVELPAGATLLSAEVEGEKVSPVVGADGSRVPLLRAGFRPSGPYNVSFVYLSSGAAFGKNGSYEMAVPKLDVPIDMVTWEVFLPDRLDVKQFGGNAISAAAIPESIQESIAADDSEGFVLVQNGAVIDSSEIGNLGPGQVGGIVVDPAGAVVSGASITVTNTQTGAIQIAKSDSEGHWVVSGMPPGPCRVRVDQPGFAGYQQDLDLKATQAARLGVTLSVGAKDEVVNVQAAGTQALNAETAQQSGKRKEPARKMADQAVNTPSQNVANLQKRVAGILPVQVDVPRAGLSYRFVRPLVLGEETKVTFQYRLRDRAR
jgi:hypothetical protein